jgi:hypothetical protein
MIDFEIRSLFDKLNNIYAEFCSHFEYLAIDIYSALFSWWAVPKQYVPKKHTLVWKLRII